MSLRIKVVKLFILFPMFLGGTSGAMGEIIGSRAKRIEAAFLLQFINYVKWPDVAFSSATAPIIVGIFGRDPFGSILDTIGRTRKAGGRKVEIRRYNNLSSLTKSHILFIASERVEQIEEIVKLIGTSPVLLVGDSPGFLNFRAINFVMVDTKIRFDINRQNLEKYGLSLSSKLLKVANEVQ